MATFTVRRRGTAKPLTTAQRLDRIIKSARQIMRKDKGLNGDLDRLPMLTWIMFLKFLDDMERIEETRAGLAGRTWRPVVEQPWRWRDWAAPADGITGADLLSSSPPRRRRFPTAPATRRSRVDPGEAPHPSGARRRGGPGYAGFRAVRHLLAGGTAEVTGG